jgi:hypothetical protein
MVLVHPAGSLLKALSGRLQVEEDVAFLSKYCDFNGNLSYTMRCIRSPDLCEMLHGKEHYNRRPIIRTRIPFSRRFRFYHFPFKSHRPSQVQPNRSDFAVHWFFAEKNRNGWFASILILWSTTPLSPIIVT